MAEAVKQMKVIVFQLNQEEYTIPVDHVGSIERVMPITRVPGTTEFVKGVVNLRGVITPIIDLRERFDLNVGDHTDQTRIIIAAIEGMDVGLIVDSANDVLDIDEGTIQPPPEVVGTVEVEYIRGVTKVDHRLLMLLNVEKILTRDEVKTLKKMDV